MKRRIYPLSCLILSSLLLPAQPAPLLGAENTDDYTVSIPESEKEPVPTATYDYDEKQAVTRDRWLFLGNISASYLHSYLDGDNSLSGADISGVFAPGYRINDRLLISVMYDGQYYKKRDYYSDLVGPRLRTEYQRHTVTPMLRYHFGLGNRYSIRPSLFYTRTYNKDVAGGGWSDGLYNYRDKGVGLDFDMRRDAFDAASGIFRCGIQYYQRRYPNFDSLLDLATGLGVEEDERDYHGLLFRSSYGSGKTGDLRWAMAYYVLFKYLDDKKTVESDGVLSSNEQKDTLQSLSLRLSYFPPRLTQLRLGLDLVGSLNTSNQNYYDGMGTISLADDVFLHEYYDYFSYQVRPNISYNFDPLPLSLHLAYAFQKTNYSERLAQNSDGTYKNDEEYENQDVITVRLEYLLFKKLVTFAQWEYLDVTSNNDDESVYHYDHRVQTWQIGVSYTF